ncbi:hypothetical protein RI129_011226 [Pyrocoelia pectoralis]|uniref:DUF7869 domain-containing protein n=1 Tax=Pyrocoelia pectoralis TaxID=417401 RepID=A0AAN7ZAL1_9COLE
MYRTFKEKYPRSIVTYKFYSEIFHTEFPHLRFGRPRSDTCGICDKYTNKIKACDPGPEKKNLINALELHHRKSEKARLTMTHDMAGSQKINSDTNVVSIDLEQVLFLPTLTHSAMFYSRQLSCYNLDVHLSDTECAYMCLWEETLTGRGGNEIASCLLKALSQETDNCIGQNKNKIMLMLFIYLVTSGMYDEIEQKFLVSGHSYLPCDRDFAQIERRKRVTKTFVPADIKAMIVGACHKHPFTTITMETEDFKDFQRMADNVLNTSKLQISTVSSIMIDKNNPTLVKTRKSYSIFEEWQVCNVLRKGKTKHDILGLELCLLECKNRISAEKLKNLEDMLDYIPLKYYQFWSNLIEKSKKR